MGRNWTLIYRHYRQTELVNQIDRDSKALIVRTGTQAVYRHRWDIFGLFERRSPIAWTAWLKELEIYQEQ